MIVVNTPITMKKTPLSVGNWRNGDVHELIKGSHEFGCCKQAITLIGECNSALRCFGDCKQFEVAALGASHSSNLVNVVGFSFPMQSLLKGPDGIGRYWGIGHQEAYLDWLPFEDNLGALE